MRDSKISYYNSWCINSLKTSDECSAKYQWELNLKKVFLFSARRRNVKSLPKPNVNRRLCSSADRVEVRLFVNSKRLKAKQNFIARIAVINPKETFVNVHFWDVSDTKATIKSSKPRKTRFEGRKTNYVKLGETKLGKCRNHTKNLKIETLNQFIHNSFING